MSAQTLSPGLSGRFHPSNRSAPLLAPSWVQPIPPRSSSRLAVLALVLAMGLSAIDGLGASAAVAQVQPEGPSTQTVNARPTLRPGSQGEVVSELQAMLKFLGYYSGSVDGVYQDSTTTAVATFQQIAGLPVDGIVGPATWNRLLPVSPATASTNPPVTASTRGTVFPAPTAPPTPAPLPAPTPSGESVAAADQSIDLPVLRLGMKGPAVTHLQERLVAIGFFAGPVDGIFGEGTQEAVKAAQANFALEADGVVGPATWTALLQ